MSISPFTTGPTVVPATDRQIETLRGLMAAKAVLKTGQVTPEDMARIDSWIAKGVSRAFASENIGRLIEETKGAPKPDVDVPAGRYAVATEDGATNTLAFYKVDRPTEGRWAGYVFVKLMVSDEEQRMGFAAGKAILAKIAEAGVESASRAYGREIGKCGVCGRTLTNDESRANGIGPICAASF